MEANADTDGAEPDTEAMPSTTIRHQASKSVAGTPRGSKASTRNGDTACTLRPALAIEKNIDCPSIRPDHMGKRIDLEVSGGSGQFR